MTNSVYELMDPLFKERKTRFWDFFDGDALRNWWNFVDNTGTGTSGMNDAVDDGGFIQSGTNNGDSSSLCFNDIRHYNFDGSIFLARLKGSSTTDTIQVGFSNNAALNSHNIQIDYLSTTTNYELRTKDGSTATVVDTGIAKDTIFHIWELEIRPSSAHVWNGDDLVGIKTNNLPNVALQPVIKATRETVTMKTSCSYLEAYNT